MQFRSTLLALAALTAALASIPAAQAADPKPIEPVCLDGIAGPDCAVRALDCAVGFGHRTYGYAYAGAWCGRPTWHPCTLAFADTDGNVGSCLIA